MLPAVRSRGTRALCPSDDLGRLWGQRPPQGPDAARGGLSRVRCERRVCRGVRSHPPSTLHITAACTAHVCTLAHTRAHTHTHTQSAACTVNVCCLVSEPKWKVAIFVCIGKCGPSSNSAMLNSFIFWGCYSHSSLYMQGRSPLETRPVRFEWPGQSFPLPLRGSNDLT